MKARGTNLKSLTCHATGARAPGMKDVSGQESWAPQLPRPALQNAVKKVKHCLSSQNMLCCFLFPPSLADHTGLVLKNIFTNLIRQPNTPGKLL